MKEKKNFLFVLCILMLFTFYVSPRLAVGEDTEQSIKTPGVGGGMTSTGTGSGTVSTASGGFRSRGFDKALSGGTRYYRWVTDSTKSAPADKSSIGATDGTPYSSKDNTFTTTVLASTIKVGQQADGSTFGVSKAFLSFNTSGIPQDANNIVIDLVFYAKRPVIDNGGSDFYLKVFKSVFEEPLWNSDWATAVGGSLEALDSKINATQLKYPADPNASIETIEPDSCRNVIRIKDPVSLIGQGGTTKLALISSRTFEGAEPVGNEYVEIYAPTAPNKSLRPELRISYKGSAPQVKPALTWLVGDPFYKDNGAQPATVYEGPNLITFRVRYVSIAADGTSGSAPSVHQLLIDLSGDQDYDESGEIVEMVPIDANDNDYSDGRDYEAKVNVTSNGSNIRYRFQFKTAAGAEATGIPNTSQVIPVVQASKDSKSGNNLCFISSIKW